MLMPTASSMSELSSLHEGGTSDFRHTYQTVQMKALPPIEDMDDHLAPRGAAGTQSRRLRRDRRNQSDDELDRRFVEVTERELSIITRQCLETEQLTFANACNVAAE